MRVSVILILLMLLINTVNTVAEDKYDASNTSPVLAIGMKNHPLISSNIPHSPCKGNKTSDLDSTTMFMILDQHECQRDGEEEPVIFYEALLPNGTKAFIDSSDVYANDKDIDRLIEMSDDDLKELLKNSKKFLPRLREGNKDRKYESTFQDRIKMHGLALLKNSIFDVSDYTDGTGYEVAVANMSKSKTIKYVTFALVGYNSVGDPVKSRKGNVITLKGIGPIEPDGVGSYNWDYVWFTDVVQSHKLKSITVQYMDGSKKVFSDMKAISVPREIATKILTD